MAEVEAKMSKHSDGGAGEELGEAESALNPLGLDLEQLVALERRFHDASHRSLQLTSEQFVTALVETKQTEGQRADHTAEFRALFKKIDASCMNTVNWNQFTDFMLFHLPVATAAEGLSSFGTAEEEWNPGAHVDHINAVEVLPAEDKHKRRYVTCARDGLVKVWHAGTLMCLKTLDVATGATSRAQPGAQGEEQLESKHWLSSCKWMSKSKRLCVASADGYLTFFASNLNDVVGRVQLDATKGSPLCLGYHEVEPGRAATSASEMLMVGDAAGWLTVFSLKDGWKLANASRRIGLVRVERHIQYKRSAESGELLEVRTPRPAEPHAVRTPRTPAAVDEDEEDDQDDRSHRGVKIFCAHLHPGEWVTKVGFVQDAAAIVTCGLDGVINICRFQENEGVKHREGQEPVRLHKKGVHCWCWCSEGKFFASCGMDRLVIVWDGFTMKPMTQLQGHTAAVNTVLMNEPGHQLVSVSVDHIVKVWDTRNFRCIQTMHIGAPAIGRVEEATVSVTFDPDGPALVLGTRQLSVWPLTTKQESKMTHRARIYACLYNDVFHQLVSADGNSTVCVWSVRTGQLDCEFQCHGDQKVTCMCFDETKRRLLTGSADGTLKLWNFSSGQHLRTFVKESPTEILGLFCVVEGPNVFLCACGFDRRLYIWSGSDSRKQTVECLSVLEDEAGHQDDVSCSAEVSSSGQAKHIDSMVATGGEDGLVLLWKTQPQGTKGTRALKFRFEDPQRSEKDRRARAVDAERADRLSDAAENDEEDAAFDEHALAAWIERGTQQYSDSVEKLLYLPKFECLVSSHSDRYLRFWTCRPQSRDGGFLFRCLPPALPAWDVPTGRSSVLSPSHASDAEGEAPSEPPSPAAAATAEDPPVITALCATSELLFSGDSWGAVSIFDLDALSQALQPHEKPERHERHEAKPELARVRCFYVHKRAPSPRYTTITHIEAFVLDDQPLVVTVSLDQCIVLSTQNGDKVGLFAAGTEWRLGKLDSWLPDEAPSLQDEGESQAQQKPKRRQQSPERQRGRARDPNIYAHKTTNSSSAVVQTRLRQVLPGHEPNADLTGTSSGVLDQLGGCMESYQQDPGRGQTRSQMAQKLHESLRQVVASYP